MAFKRLIILSAPLVQLILLELIFFWSQGRLPSTKAFLAVIFVFLSAVCVFSVWQLSTGLRFRIKLELIFFTGFLVHSIALFSFLITKSFFLHWLYVLAVILLFLWLRILGKGPLDSGGQYRGEVANFVVWASVLIVFFLFSFFYGLQSYLNISVWRLSLAMVGILATVFYLIIRVSNISLVSGTLYLIINCLILTEIAWAIFFLPFHFTLLGAVFTFCFYVTNGLSRLCLVDKLTAKALKFYLTIGLGGLILILLTARWI